MTQEDSEIVVTPEMDEAGIKCRREFFTRAMVRRAISVDWEEYHAAIYRAMRALESPTTIRATISKDGGAT